jgi:hypothetical protein
MAWLVAGDFYPDYLLTGCEIITNEGNIRIFVIGFFELMVFHNFKG